MAYVNVRDWSVDQVIDWFKGLDNTVLPYTSSLLNNGVTGAQLLNLRAEDLEHLGVKLLGHQELILEAVEHLRNFHYELDKENLQMLALKLSCASNSLYRELVSVSDDCTMVSTQTLSDVHNIITAIKPLVCWLGRAPFLGDKYYVDCKDLLLDLSFEMATSAHRDIFSDRPVCTIRTICERICKEADHVIQEISDPMILQPASLDLATLKKKEQELGFFILPSNHAIHQIAEIKYGSPAHSCTKIEEGDEIVQVNYQTVVGWHRKNVMLLLQDSPPEIVLTLKKRPRHTKVYGQIYMKPYRLPSKKRDGHLYSRWNDSIPSPRLLPIPNLPPIKIIKIPSDVEPSENEADTELSSSDSEPPDSPGSGRMYPLKPRPILQRRNTITGATPTRKKPYPSVEQYWEAWKNRATSTTSSSCNIDSAKFDTDSNFLRDKSASCNLGLELSPRPTTVIGLSSNHRTNLKKSFKRNDTTKKKVNFEEKKIDFIIDDQREHQQINLIIGGSNLDEQKSVSVNSLASLTNESIAFIDEGRELTDRSSMVTDTENIKSATGQTNNCVLKDAALAEVKIFDIIKKFDEFRKEDDLGVKPKIFPRSQAKKPPDVPSKPDPNRKPAVPPRCTASKVRGRLDKSHSTPAYDLTEDEAPKFFADTPPSPSQQTDGPVTNGPPPDIVPQSSVTPTTELLKYELGIPIVEPQTPTPPSPIIINEEPLHLPLDLDEEPPPKPPPRNFGLTDIPKPAYPIDSPKPVLGDKFKLEPSPMAITATSATTTAATNQTVFEFPESKQQNLYSCEIHNVVANYKIYNEPTKCKGFEPKLVSTPKPNDGDMMPCYKSATLGFDVQKSTSDSKISPTNSIKAMIYSNKTRAGKKKASSIVSRRRKVTVHDLSPADNQGFLYQRLRMKHNQNVHWEKRWFVLLGSALYGFKTKDDPRASCLIFLSGYTVAVASEVKSRSNAFKVYHTGKVFYFSADDPETLQCWIELITAATLHSDPNKSLESSLYSETDDENEGDKSRSSSYQQQQAPAQQHQAELKKFGSLKKFDSKKSDNSGHNGGSTSLDRKWFFNKSSSHSKNSLPVPTAQFRSYRKIKTEVAPPSVTTGNFTSHVAFFAPSREIPKLNQAQNVSVPNLTVDHFNGATANNILSNNNNNNNSNNNNNNNREVDSKKLAKPKPLNYIHASNPSLCNIGEFNVVPGFTKKPPKQCSDNLAGFVTLQELMIKQSEERKLNPYHADEDFSINFNLIKPDVVYGEVPIRPKDKSDFDSRHSTLPADSTKPSDSGSSCFGKRLGSIKRSTHRKESEFESRTATYPKIGRGFDQKLNRSLPRTHKLQDNKPSTQMPLTPITKERSYEMIYCPETTTTDIQFAQNRQLDDKMYKETIKKSGSSGSSKLKKQHSFNAHDKKFGKIQDLSKLSNRVGDSSKVRLKSAMQYTPMSLPLTQDVNKGRPKLAFELNLDEKGASSKGGKFKQIFGKPSDGGKKEKTFLGSPKLHRAIFRKNHSGNETNWAPVNVAAAQSSYSPDSYSLSDPLPVNLNPPTTDYPGLEYPPVFEPETYSLADPQSSLTILRKQGKNN